MLPTPHQSVSACNRVRGNDKDGRGNQRRHARIETRDKAKSSGDFHRGREDYEETRRSKADFIKKDRCAIDVAELGDRVGQEEKSTGHANGSSRVN